MVKYSTVGGAKAGKRREQGDAIADDYDPIAEVMDKQKSSLPKRFSPEELPEKAISLFGDELLADYIETKPLLVISLGEEAWDALRRWPGLRATHSAKVFRDLKGPRYGERGEIVAGGHAAQWLPLVHPGLLGQRFDRKAHTNPDAATDVWDDHHRRWELRARTQWLEFGADRLT
jgi:hypothetical protein